MQFLDGKRVSKNILYEISLRIEELKSQGKRIPRLDMIIVGEDYGSLKYVGMKEKTAREVGMIGQIHNLNENIEMQELLHLIDSLNRDENIDGYMIQLPLPSHIDRNIIFEAIDPRKDVDGLTPTNLGKLFQKDKTGIPPATPVGIVKLLEDYNIKFLGRNVVILGASIIIGKPLAAMFLEKNATVTICNSHTLNTQDIARTADILISAIGKPLLIKNNYLKPDCVVVDVGSNKHPETGVLVGDVDLESVAGIPSYITPVPGGVGPMTIASLMLNLMKCYEDGNR